MKALFAAILAGAGCLLISARWVHAAAECPAVVKGGDAFVVERGEQSKTEVSFGTGAVISAVTRFRGQPLLELRQYEGLIFRSSGSIVATGRSSSRTATWPNSFR